jgi:hypothetical protein
MPSRSSIIGHPAMRVGQVLQSPHSDTGPGKLAGARDCMECVASWPNHGVQLTAYSARCAPASGSS